MLAVGSGRSCTFAIFGSSSFVGPGWSLLGIVAGQTVCQTLLMHCGT